MKNPPRMSLLPPKHAQLRPVRRNQRFHTHGSQRGAALIITLAILVLVTALVVALFVSVTSERTESSASANQGDANRLATGVVKLVEATITQATTGYESDPTTGAPDTGKPTAWASQPGLIRTWKQNGTPDRTFRLYSSGDISTAGALDLAAERSSLDGWKSGSASYNASWCDINAPAATESNDLSYPIVTPPSDTNSGSTASDATNGVPTDNPDTAIQEGVQGFAVTASPGFTASDSASAINNPVPMPVKWLYVLQDGSFVSPTGNSTTTSVAGATQDNPIIGRVAYWTDDETSKVNINTASEGVYWDVPRGGGKQETVLAVNAPVYNEWQRVPGHPATTSLSAVFEEFSARTAADLQKIYSLTPRTAWGGSEMGTKPLGAPVSFTPGGNVPGSPAVIPTLPTSISLPSTRLFSSVEELYFSPTKPSASAPRDTNTAGLSSEDVKARAFFLTATSRASDTNLFEQPRVCLWPITWINTGLWGALRTDASSPSIPSGDPSTQAITDTLPQSMLPSEKLIAFASSVGRPLGGVPYRYFFTRQKALDATHDFDNIQRNRELFDYLRSSTSRDIPGFGRSFEAKWGTQERSQILASAFDFIRGTVNLNTALHKSGTSLNLDPRSYFYTPYISRQTGVGSDGGVGNAGRDYLSAGQVIPIRFSRDGIDVGGAGRTPTITEAALVFYAIEREDPVIGEMNATDHTGAVIGKKYTIDATKLISSTSSQTTKLGCFLVLEMCNPVVGLPLNSVNSYGVRVAGSPFQINGAAMDFPKSTGQVNLVNGFIGDSPRRDTQNSPFMGIHSPFVGTSSTSVNDGVRTVSQSFSPNTYPFYGSVAVNPGTSTFNFSGGVVTIEILAPNPSNRGAGDPSSSPVSKTITLDFSKLNGAYPMPRAPRFNAATSTVTNSSFGASNPPVGTALVQQSSGSPAAPDDSKYPRQQDEVSGHFIPNPVPTDEIVTQVNPTASTALRRYTYQYTSSNGTGTSDTESHRNLDFRLKLIQWNSIKPTAFNVSSRSAVYTPYDTVLSLGLDGYGPAEGDVRLVATRADVPASWYNPIPPALRSLNYGTRNPSGGKPAPLPMGWIDNTAPSPTVWLHLLSPGATGGGDGDPGATPAGRALALDFMPAGFSFGLLGRNIGNTAFTPDNTFALIASNRFQSQNGANLPGMMDWTGSAGNLVDGAIIDKPSEIFSPITRDVYSGNFIVPFFSGSTIYSEEGRFSPNRQMISAVQFGTLPSGAYRSQPWQTLLFSPNPQAGSAHPGLSTPKPFSITNTAPSRPLAELPDHLLLDLFSMPVSEPFPISEPLSTAGKININYQIAPFTHIERKTGIHAVLKSVQIPIFVRSQAANYKSMVAMADGRVAFTASDTKFGSTSYAVGGFPATAPESGYATPALSANQRTRYTINVDETLKGFDAFFSAGEVFRSASEVCDMFLVPRTDDSDPAGTVAPPGIPTTLASIKSWWTSTDASSPIITADNLRESPYNQIYPRITTKSNTYTVHMRVQALKQIPAGRSSASDWSAWNESKDQVVAEYRGSSTIERYVDPNDPNIPDFTLPANSNKNLAPYYRWRTISKKQFLP